MQGAIGVWIFADVAGIEQAPGTAGWSNILIAPKVTTHEAVPSVVAWHNTIRGMVNVSWTNSSSTSFTLDTTIPVNTQAEVRIPYAGGSSSAVTVTDSGTTIFTGGAYKPGVAGIISASADDANSVISVLVGSGSFNFAASW